MTRRWQITLPLLLILLMLAIGAARAYLVPANAEPTSKHASTSNEPAVKTLPIAGAASCSARGCHGSIEPVNGPERCGQNEYTLWTHDRHADAYRTLFSERSALIVKRLGGNIKAHDDAHCLACHVTPALARMPHDSAFVQEEKLFGVGCESCHGSANDWLVAHTARDWRQKKPGYAMPDLADPVVHAKACVGCHVGGADGDVNHDLIAAGHPRLNFEFGSFSANMPPHWRPRPQADAQLWAIGQLVSAQTALALTARRADAGPWPEFAESDCFACHHALTGTRQERRTKPGTLPWGTWYFALTRDLSGPSDDLDRLKTTMQMPYPDRVQAKKQALAALQTQSFPADKAASIARTRILDRFRNGTLDVDPCWDSAEQIYLAMYALNPSPALQSLATERAFAPGYDGPLSLPIKERTPFRASAFIDELRSLTK